MRVFFNIILSACVWRWVKGMGRGVVALITWLLEEAVSLFCFHLNGVVTSNQPFVTVQTNFLASVEYGRTNYSTNSYSLLMFSLYYLYYRVLFPRSSGIGDLILKVTLFRALHDCMVIWTSGMVCFIFLLYALVWKTLISFAFASPTV